MSRDLGNRFVIEERDEALGRAYEWEDQTTTLRLFKRESEVAVLENMEHFGGSFVKALANAARHADLTSYERIRDAFPHYWKNYSEERCDSYKG